MKDSVSANRAVRKGQGMATTTGTIGNDLLSGTADADVISALDGDDTVLGEGGNDTLWGGLDNDLLSGAVGDDVIYGNLASDTLLGDAGVDTLYGGQGGDTLSGADGDDVMYGNLGDDVDYGGAGNDTITASFNGTFHGGADADTFVLSAGGRRDFSQDSPTASVLDFEHGLDSIRLSGFGGTGAQIVEAGTHRSVSGTIAYKADADGANALTAYVHGGNGELLAIRVVGVRTLDATDLTFV